MNQRNTSAGTEYQNLYILAFFVIAAKLNLYLVRRHSFANVSVEREREREREREKERERERENERVRER